MRVPGLFLFIFCTVLSTVNSEAMAKALCVTADGANLRSGPGTEFDVSWRVNRYMPFVERDEKDGWVKVEDLTKTSHWISKKVVNEKIECAVVKTETAFLRKEPRKESSDDVKIDKFTPLKVLSKSHGWFEVESSLGDKFWIYGRNVWQP
jgi:uncharacterized protein YgiM (DUF1202 family)